MSDARKIRGARTRASFRGCLLGGAVGRRAGRLHRVQDPRRDPGRVRAGRAARLRHGLQAAGRGHRRHPDDPLHRRGPPAGRAPPPPHPGGQGRGGGLARLPALAGDPGRRGPAPRHPRRGGLAGPHARPARREGSWRDLPLGAAQGAHGNARGRHQRQQGLRRRDAHRPGGLRPRPALPGRLRARRHHPRSPDRLALGRLPGPARPRRGRRRQPRRGGGARPRRAAPPPRPRGDGQRGGEGALALAGAARLGRRRRVAGGGLGGRGGAGHRPLRGAGRRELRARGSPRGEPRRRQRLHRLHRREPSRCGAGRALHPAPLAGTARAARRDRAGGRRPAPPLRRGQPSLRRRAVRILGPLPAPAGRQRSPREHIE